MSRTRPTEGDDRPKNPAAKFIEWKGSTGEWSWWDKAAKERKTVGAKQAFIVLDLLSTVTGRDGDGNNIYANEVRKAGDKLTVFCDKKVVAEGAWRDIRDSFNGMKWTQSAYCLADVGDGPEIVCLKLAASGLGPKSADPNENHPNHFFEVKNQGVTDQDKCLQVMGVEDGKNGAVSFKCPIFQVATIQKPESMQMADEADAKLQEYLDQYFAYQASRSQQPAGEDMSELPQPEPVAAGAPDIGWETGGDDDSIPFAPHIEIC